MSAETPHFYEFENFRLDPKEKILFRDDQPVPLTPKVFETLQIFVEHAGRLLEKDDLMRKIWEDRFVEESNLTFNIKMLRRTLNDDAHQPRFIETVPRRGYRFIAPVNQHVNGSTLGVDTIELARKPTTDRVRGFYVLIASLLVLIGAISIAFWLSRSAMNASTLSVPLLSKPFRSENVLSPGTTNAAITPDGKYVAYTTDSGGKHSLWLRKLETSESIQIVPPSNGDYLGLTISHDGNALYFTRRSDSDGKYAGVYRVMTFGGIPVKITESNRGRVGVSPDDSQISFVRCPQQDQDFCSLLIADAEGKNERVLATRPRPFRIVDPSFAPDGNSIAFATGQSRNGGSDFRLVRYDLTNGREKEISSRRFFEIKSLMWLPNGDDLLFTAQERLDGPSKIWQVSTATGEVKALTGDANTYANISLDKTADKMIATQITNTHHLYIARTNEANGVKSLIPARTFTFAPTGKIVYAGVDGDIWTINRDGEEQRQLTNSPFKDFSPRVSPDGRYIFFCSARSGSNQIWRMNADGSDQIQLTQSEGGVPRFVTTDQRWIYFESTLSSSLWRMSVEGAEETQVSKAKVGKSAFSPDGKFVAYFYRPKEDDDHFKIGVMSLESGNVIKTFALDQVNSIPYCIAWDVNNESFYFVTWNGTTSLWRQSLKTDRPTFISGFGSEDVDDLAISPDGQSIGFIRGQWIHSAVLIQGLK